MSVNEQVIDPTTSHRRGVAKRKRRVLTAVVALAAAGGLGVAGLNLAGAQTTSTTLAPPSSSTTTAPEGASTHADAIHGEFVRPDGKGGYETVDEQVGSATAVSATSLTVKSADGFTKTYVLTKGTIVVAGREGIANVSTGDQVRVEALVSGTTATATRVVDVTTTTASTTSTTAPTTSTTAATTSTSAPSTTTSAPSTTTSAPSTTTSAPSTTTSAPSTTTSAPGTTTSAPAGTSSTTSSSTSTTAPSGSSTTSTTA